MHSDRHARVTLGRGTPSDYILGEEADGKSSTFGSYTTPVFVIVEQSGSHMRLSSDFESGVFFVY